MSTLIEKLKQNEDAIFGKGVSKRAVTAAEEQLKVTFSREFDEYLQRMGILAVDGHEITGLLGSERVNVVEVTRHQREMNSNVYPNLYVIEETNFDGIVIWQDEFGSVYKTKFNGQPKKICSSIEEYLGL